MEAFDVETGVVRGDGKLSKFKEGMVEREVCLEGRMRLKVVREDKS